MVAKIFVVFVVALISSESFSSATSNFVCYHGTWAAYRTGNGTFGVSAIDTSHCTHLIYSFMGVYENGTIQSLDSWLDYDLDTLNSFTALKSARSDLKVLAAIGGWTYSTTFPTVAASATTRAAFLQSALEFVQTYNFDGIDFDWEYPNRRGGTEVDIQNFVTLLQEFKAAFEPLGLILSAAVSATASSVALSYDVPAVAQYVDMINVMTYDLRGSWDGVTGHNSPLYASTIDLTSTELELNVDACITNWIAQGAAPAKLNLGLPFYGRTFTLSSSDVSLGAPSSAGGVAGPYTQEVGYLGYNEIVEKINAGGWTYVWDSVQQVPHMYNGDQWVGFDDPTSLTLKVKYAQSKNLGGVMVWAIETDDFKALSGTKNPLLNAITTQLAAGSSSDSDSDTTTTTTTTTTEASTTTTAATTTTTAATTTTTADATTTTTAATTTTTIAAVQLSDTSSVCTAAGYVRDSETCSIFYQCTENTDGTFTANTLTCPDGLVFDTSCNVCNWASLVTC